MGGNRALFYSSTLSALLLGTTIVSILSVGNYAYAADNNWYVGEGAKQDSYVTYHVQHLDTNNGRPFDMTIYFEKQDSNGDWTAPVYVVDQGKVFNGTLKLGAIDLTVLGGGSDVSKDLAPYVSAYKGSLQWLSAYVPKPGQSLTAGSWGKIGSIGGSEIKPSGTEKITVKGGTFDTTKIVYHKSVDNVIWVANEFPLPIKALTYADVTTGNPPVQYAFELTATGNGKPPTVSGTTEIPKPPLEERTERGTYFVDLDWSPADIQPSKEITFQISFFDNNHNPINDVSYDFKVTDSHGNVMQDLKNKFVGNSPDTLKLTFNASNAGPVTIDVNINAVGSRDQGEFVESAQFGIVAAPEFPAGAVYIGTAALIGVVFVLTRFMRGGLSRLSGAQG
jgi:hypothetical protein